MTNIVYTHPEQDFVVTQSGKSPFILLFRSVDFFNTYSPHSKHPALADAIAEGEKLVQQGTIISQRPLLNVLSIQDTLGKIGSGVLVPDFLEIVIYAEDNTVGIDYPVPHSEEGTPNNYNSQSYSFSLDDWTPEALVAKLQEIGVQDIYRDDVFVGQKDYKFGDRPTVRRSSFKDLFSYSTLKEIIKDVQGGKIQPQLITIQKTPHNRYHVWYPIPGIIDGTYDRHGILVTGEPGDLERLKSLSAIDLGW